MAYETYCTYFRLSPHGKNLYLLIVLWYFDLYCWLRGSVSLTSVAFYNFSLLPVVPSSTWYTLAHFEADSHCNLQQPKWNSLYLKMINSKTRHECAQPLVTKHWNNHYFLKPVILFTCPLAKKFKIKVSISVLKFFHMCLSYWVSLVKQSGWSLN